MGLSISSLCNMTATVVLSLGEWYVGVEMIFIRFKLNLWPSSTSTSRSRGGNCLELVYAYHYHYDLYLNTYM